MIERSIISAFEEWRAGQVTRWNRVCSRAFKSILSKFENDFIDGINTDKTLNASPESLSIRNVYEICGFPLNSCYTDVQAICSAVHNTAIHTHLGNGVEFALAVHCVGYPGQFASVWVYVASLTRK
jgi:hypothetical protein